MHGEAHAFISTSIRKYNFENSVIVVVPSAEFQRWIPNLICVFVLVAVEEIKRSNFTFE